MALNSSGPISLGGSTAGQSINLENGLSATAQVSLNDAAVRNLAGVASGAITMPTNFWGKSNYYTLDNSVRLRRDASGYFSRTFAAAPTTRTKFTVSFWHKRGKLATVQNIFIGYDGGSAIATQMYFNGDDTFSFDYGGGAVYGMTTTANYRDPSAWYHIVVAADTTQATASERVKIYINGSQVTALSTANYPPQNALHQYTYNNSLNRIGTQWNFLNYMDGYFSEFNFIDGQTLTPSSFGAANANTGVWQPKQYTGSYGTNGFYLKFSDIATTSGSNAGLGKDFSGSSNYWTTNNISVTAGATYDAMVDSPTPNSSTLGNYCVMSPINMLSGSVSNGNLKTASASGVAQVDSTFAMTAGKWYWEALYDAQVASGGNTYPYLGIQNVLTRFGASALVGNDVNGVSVDARGQVVYNGGTQATYTAFGTSDIAMFAYDADTGKLWVGRNGTWFNSGAPASGTGQVYTLSFSSGAYVAVSNYSSSTASFNFGQRPFSYTPPTGFNRLQTYNIPTPTIGATASTLASKYFAAVAYTGNGISNTNAITTGFQPDLVWIKSRNEAYSHVLADAVRGNYKSLRSSSTEAEYTFGVNAFNSTGFTVGNGNGVTNATESNNSGINFASWSWNAGNSSVTNTAGTITSTVRANTTCGFSVVKYTGNGTQGATVGHGLGVAPKMIFIKNYGAGEYWYVYNEPTYTGTGYYLWLNTTDGARSTNAGSRMPSAPTSSVMTLGNLAEVNGSQGMIAYCWAEIAGFSKIGKYIGNGSSDGPFVYCGFRPRFILVKRSSNISNWVMWDTTRAPYNQIKPQLFSNTADSEDNTGECDALSNGFKIRGTNASWNGSGDTIIYMAFAENPFNYSLAR